MSTENPTPGQGREEQGAQAWPEMAYFPANRRNKRHLNSCRLLIDLPSGDSFAVSVESRNGVVAIDQAALIVAAVNQRGQAMAAAKALEEIQTDCERLSKDEICDKGEQRTWKSIAVRLKSVRALLAGGGK